MIEVEQLSKRFGHRLALDRVSFIVPPGEVLGLAGANGSGKSTLLRILATLVPPDSGSARIGGASVVSEPGIVRQSVGYVPDTVGVYPRQTVKEFLEFFAGVHGLPVPQRRKVAGELLELVGLADRADDEAESLSRGQRQRLCLAQALVHDPAVLLLDDTSGLDPLAQAELRALIVELGAMGKTIVMCGHHLADLEETCTWLVVLDEGRAVASGPIAEITEGRSLHEAFLQLTGEPPE